MEERIWIVEDAKTEKIVFRGTKEECLEWTDEQKDNRAYIVRKVNKCN